MLTTLGATPRRARVKGSGGAAAGSRVETHDRARDGDVARGDRPRRRGRPVAAPVPRRAADGRNAEAAARPRRAGVRHAPARVARAVRRGQPGLARASARAATRGGVGGRRLHRPRRFARGTRVRARGGREKTTFRGGRAASSSFSSPPRSPEPRPFPPTPPQNPVFHRRRPATPSTRRSRCRAAPSVRSRFPATPASRGRRSSRSSVRTANRSASSTRAPPPTARAATGPPSKSTRSSPPRARGSASSSWTSSPAACAAPWSRSSRPPSFESGGWRCARRRSRPRKSRRSSTPSEGSAPRAKNPGLVPTTRTSA